LSVDEKKRNLLGEVKLCSIWDEIETFRNFPGNILKKSKEVSELSFKT
jgi:hypothetical protein